MEKADAYYRALGHGSFGGGNIKHGLSTIEEKSVGAYAKSGSRAIVGLLKPGDRPRRPGLHLMDTVNDGPVRLGIPNINDTQTVTEMVASGCQLIVFTTGAGSVVGQAIAPIIKGVSNSRVFQRLSDDIDVNGGTIADGQETIQEVGEHILRKIAALASGEQSRSEFLGHQEFASPIKPMNRRDRPASRLDNEGEETMTKLNRMMLAAALVVGAVLPSAADAADPVRLRLNWMYYGSHAPFALGKDKGYFRMRESISISAPAMARGRPTGWWPMATASSPTAPAPRW